MEKEESAKVTIILEVFTLAQNLNKFSDSISRISTLCLEYGEG